MWDVGRVKVKRSTPREYERELNRPVELVDNVVIDETREGINDHLGEAPSESQCPVRNDPAPVSWIRAVLAFALVSRTTSPTREERRSAIMDNQRSNASLLFVVIVATLLATPAPGAPEPTGQKPLKVFILAYNWCI